MVVNFIIIYLKGFKKIMTLRCIQHTMKGNLLLLKDLSEL